MTQLTNVYLVAQGSWTTGAWVGESAQFGLRLCPTVKAASPAMGEAFTPQVTGDVEIDQGTLVGAHGTLSRTWTARIGMLSSPENWNAQWQMERAEAMWTFLDSMKSYVSSSFKWSGVKISAVAATGHVVQNSAVYSFTAPLAGTASTVLPPQLALALSLRANVLGRRGRGRIYLPAVGASQLAADGTVSSTFAATARTNFKALVDSLQTAGPTDLNQPIVSIMSASSPTAIRPVEIRTGNRFDTIQSRRRQVAEAYTSLPL